MNVYDSERMADSLEKTHNLVSDPRLADAILLNTCHIREKAAEKVYSEVGKFSSLKNKNQKLKIIVAGCVAQAEGKAMLRRQPIIDAIIGPQAYQVLPKVLSLKSDKNKIFLEFQEEEKFSKLGHNRNKALLSSFITIQEGCDKFCSFCVVPFTRGAEYSRYADDIINEAKILSKKGCREIILLGQNVNAYSYKDGDKNYKLSNLILELDKIEDLKRIRYTTSHPRDMTEDLIDCYSSSKKLMPFVHLPIQSGSDRILKLMNRNHNVEKYLEIYKMIKQKNNNVEFSSDFIVGYPGEMESDFNDTMSLVKEIRFINSYSFIFSPRPGTPASRLKLVENEIAKERLIKIQKVLADHQIKKNGSFINSSIEVLVENKLKNQNKYFGRNIYLNPVIFEGGEKYLAKLVNVKITKVNRNSLFGKINDNKKMKAA